MSSGTNRERSAVSLRRFRAGDARSSTAEPGEPEDSRLRRDLLKAAILDIQGSIHANDSKCAAALVVHGLLFAGTVTVVSRLGDVWRNASGDTKTAAAWSLGVAAAMLLLSIAALLWALFPYSPSKRFRTPILDRHQLPGVFFPNLKGLKKRASDRLTPYVEDLRWIDSSARLELELAYELLKVQEIRTHDARYARMGFVLLMVEILAAVTFLVAMGLEAM
jgi:hypothetical protein